MEIFDGFIAAVAAEFNLKFNRKHEGVYTIVVEFENDRSQEVIISLALDESGDRFINFYSVIVKMKADFPELYKYALNMNAVIDYGAIALMEDNFVLRNTLLLEDCEPHMFVKLLTYIAAKSDEIEETLTSKDS